MNKFAAFFWAPAPLRPSQALPAPSKSPPNPISHLATLYCCSSRKNNRYTDIDTDIF